MKRRIGKHDKAHLTEVNAEVPVELLTAHNESSAMDIDNHGRRDLHCVRTVQIHHMCPVTILLVADVILFPDTVQDFCRNTPASRKLFKFISLLSDD